jgi:hypothetical protein
MPARLLTELFQLPNLYLSVLIFLTFTPPRPLAAVVGLRPRRRAPRPSLVIDSLYSLLITTSFGPLIPISGILHLDLNRICLIH